ncbi:hypothetical protein BGZ70_006850 [Mortierella alpina]|uniref:Uncharacterized protein n=1 Tax=Mortierella alpina TaxID=64518 RepID=A0A9P6JAM8_MORAP|nr:hypothetical protein BGZ70_006850 [Mortierella alpina]
MAAKQSRKDPTGSYDDGAPSSSTRDDAQSASHSEPSTTQAMMMQPGQTAGSTSSARGMLAAVGSSGRRASRPRANSVTDRPSTAASKSRSARARPSKANSASAISYTPSRHGPEPHQQPFVYNGLLQASSSYGFASSSQRHPMEWTQQQQRQEGTAYGYQSTEESSNAWLTHGLVFEASSTAGLDFGQTPSSEPIPRPMMACPPQQRYEPLGSLQPQQFGSITSSFATEWSAQTAATASPADHLQQQLPQPLQQPHPQYSSYTLYRQQQQQQLPHPPHQQEQQRYQQQPPMYRYPQERLQLQQQHQQQQHHPQCQEHDPYCNCQPSYMAASYLQPQRLPPQSSQEQSMPGFTEDIQSFLHDPSQSSSLNRFPSPSIFTYHVYGGTATATNDKDSGHGPFPMEAVELAQCSSYYYPSAIPDLTLVAEAPAKSPILSGEGDDDEGEASALLQNPSFDPSVPEDDRTSIAVDTRLLPPDTEMTSNTETDELMAEQAESSTARKRFILKQRELEDEEVKEQDDDDDGCDNDNENDEEENDGSLKRHSQQGAGSHHAGSSSTMSSTTRPHHPRGVLYPIVEIPDLRLRRSDRRRAPGNAPSNDS